MHVTKDTRANRLAMAIPLVRRLDTISVISTPNLVPDLGGLHRQIYEHALRPLTTINKPCEGGAKHWELNG